MDLRSLCNWLKANKISLNCGKTELLIFRHPNKQINYDLKIKINGKTLIASKSVKYLGIVIDPHLNWSHHVDSLSSKLSRAIGMISKMRHFVSETTLRSIYYGIFSSLLTYGAQIWAQFNNKHVCRLQKLQDRAIRRLNFAKPRDPPSPLYKRSAILKLSDHVKLQNFLYVHNSINGSLPEALRNSFQMTSAIHDFDTRGSSQCKVILPKVRTLNYGLNSINYKSAASWNLFMTIFCDKNLHRERRTICTKLITKYFLDSYI